MPADPLLDVRSLTAGYDGGAAIRKVDITVAAGEVVVLLGPNGAGKTTTLRTVSGMVRPMAGSVSMNGRTLGRTSAESRARAGLAHVPEGRGVFADLTVAEHFRIRCATSATVRPGCCPVASSRCSRSVAPSPAAPSCSWSTSSASASRR